MKKIGRGGTDPAIPEDTGKIKWDSKFSFSKPEEQRFLAQFCDDLVCETQSGYECRYPELMSDLRVRLSTAERGLDVMRCAMTEFCEWVQTSPMPLPGAEDGDDAALLLGG